MVGQVVTACGCGWTGAPRYPTREEFDEAAEELALAEWDHAHASPVLAQAQHVELARLQRRLRDLATRGLAGIERSPRELAERLARLVRELETATALAWRLRDQAHKQADLDGGPR